MAEFLNAQRQHFYFGRILSADDLSQEQNTQIDRLRRHNRFVHGWGVVSGLKVSATGSGEVTVHPGFAIDCAGNELHVTQCVHLTVQAAVARCHVGVRYVERLSDPQVGLDGASDFARVQELTMVELLGASPVHDQRGLDAGTPGCGAPHAICLASLTLRPGGWRVVARRASYRRPR